LKAVKPKRLGRERLLGGIAPLIPTIAIWSMVGFLFPWFLYMMFQEYTAGAMERPRFAGIANFIKLAHDTRFWTAVGRTAYYSGVGTLIQVLLGLIIALSLIKFIKSDKLRLVLLIFYLIPMMISEAVSSHIWLMLATPQGYLNSILRSLGLPALPWIGPELALTTIMIADIWQWTSLPLLIIYAARLSIPQSLYEAARLDEASDWMILRQITLPYLKTPILIAALLRFMDSYKFIDKVLLMTYGGPGYASETLGFYVYQVSFTYRYLGYSGLLGLVVAFGVAGVLLIFWRVFRGGK